MLENERIIVQDRGGIDAGIAALMQNANKGFDPAALMAMMNNGNGMFGGNGGWWWIFIIVLGTVVSVSKPYDEPVPPTQFPMPMQNRRKLVDLVISCDGEQRKLSVSEDKTMMTDSSIGLTIATEKSQIVNMVRQSLEDCRIKKESLSKIDEEMRRCEDILKILNVNSDITTNVTKDFKELDELRAEVKELKQLLQNISTVRPEENNIDPPTEEKENEI